MKCVQYCSSREECKGRDIFADGAEWVQALANSFRLSFVPLTHVLATVLVNLEPSNLRDLRKDHHDMLIMNIQNRFRRFRDLFRNDTDSLAYALFEVRDYFSDKVFAPFSASGLSTVRADLIFLKTESQK